MDAHGQLVLIDEVLTPDSSRFWRITDYYSSSVNNVGIPPGFDKQHIRDYVEKLNWNRQLPAPNLSPDIIKRTAEAYKEIQTLITRI